MRRGQKEKPKSKFRNFYRSVWLFPIICAVILVLLTGFKISGSSLGQFHVLLYGGQKDSSLIFGKPRLIRSDEWLVRTPTSIAQASDNYARVNKNVGQGEDVSVSLDLPYRDWSTVFRPLDWPYLFLSFDYAFALKWWLMGYMLIIAAYFFVLKLLPGKRLVAAAVGLGLFLSPFVQWWYEYDTLAAIFYPLFMGTSFINLMNSQRTRSKLLWSGLISFFFVCFALILYPPFQIACGLALLVFVVGYLLEIRPKLNKRDWLQKIALSFVALLIGGVFVLAFLYTRSGPVKALQHTVYPGKRITQSGGYSPTNFLSGPLDFQLQFSSKAANYLVGGGKTNQSEASSFILLLPFLFLPSLYMLWAGWRKYKEVDWPLLLVDGLFALLAIRLFVAHFDTLFKPLLLSLVPHQRLIIGIGLLSAIQAVLVIRWLQTKRKPAFELPGLLVAGYSIIVLIVELLVNLHINHSSPGFVGGHRALALALPIPVIVYLLLIKKFNYAFVLFALFSIFSSVIVNPLYRSTDTLRKTPISNEIRSISAKASPGDVWLAEGLPWENFPQINGVHSLSGVYAYPQLDLWKSLNNSGDKDIYNRYAHAEFIIDRVSADDPTTLKLVGPDHFQVTTPACGSFLRQHNVHYLIAESKLGDNAGCSHLLSTVKYPQQTFYIYHLN